MGGKGEREEKGRQGERKTEEKQNRLINKMQPRKEKANGPVILKLLAEATEHSTYVLQLPESKAASRRQQATTDDR